MKKHNFYAGPSILSEYTIKNTADAVMNFNETGLSILEISHRSKEFQAVIDEANALIKELLEIPSIPRRRRKHAVLHDSIQLPENKSSIP